MQAELWVSCSDPFILRNIKSFNYSACDSFLMKTFLRRNSVGGTGKHSELLFLPLEMKLCSISRAIGAVSREVTLVLFARKDVSTLPTPVTRGVKGPVPRGSPSQLGKDRQNNQSFILVRGSVPLKYCPPSCAHMAKTRAPGYQPDKGSLCSRDVLFMRSLEEQTSPAILPPWTRCSPAFVLHACRGGNCKEGLEWELQRGAGVLPAMWDLLLRHWSDCSPSPGLLRAGWFSTRNCNCFSNFSSLLHLFTWLLRQSRRLSSRPALGPSIIAAELSLEQLSPVRTRGRSPAPNPASSGKKRPPANKAIIEDSALVSP